MSAEICTHPLTHTHPVKCGLALGGGMRSNLAGTRDTCQRSPGQNRSEVQGSAPDVPTVSSGVASPCSPPSSKPGPQAASWRPVVSTDSLQEVQHNKVWPCGFGWGSQGPSSSLSLTPWAALPARSLEAQTLTSPPRWWSFFPPPLRPLPPRWRSPGVPLWSSGCQAHSPLPSLCGHPYLLMAVSQLPAPLPPAGERLCLLVHCSEVPTSSQFQVRGVFAPSPVGNQGPLHAC